MLAKIGGDHTSNKRDNKATKKIQEDHTSNKRDDEATKKIQEYALVNKNWNSHYKPSNDKPVSATSPVNNKRTARFADNLVQGTITVPRTDVSTVWSKKEEKQFKADLLFDCKLFKKDTLYHVCSEFAAKKAIKSGKSCDFSKDELRASYGQRDKELVKERRDTHLGDDSAYLKVISFGAMMQRHDV
ncbi:MAG: hypothetical protein SGILL_002439, partial [Bacillariaceae sp.]